MKIAISLAVELSRSNVVYRRHLVEVDAYRLNTTLTKPSTYINLRSFVLIYLQYMSSIYTLPDQRPRYWLTKQYTSFNAPHPTLSTTAQRSSPRGGISES